MSWPAARSRLHYTIAIVWLVYVVSLASWWLNIGLSMPARRRMFAWEGGSFIVLLVAGGVIMVLAIRREQRRRQALETFFMAFTHDLKTALARVQLQAESLGEDWPSGAPPAALDRLLRDTVRLQIQLENSLYVAQPDGRLLAERVDAAATIARLAQDWPDVTLDIAGAGVVRADARAFETVFRNLLQNAVLHGGASRVTVRIEHPGGAHTRIVVTDNGGGVPADRLARLGEPFTRVSETSGTGVGLFVCRRLIGRLGGVMRFAGSDRAGEGLTVTVDLPGDR